MSVRDAEVVWLAALLHDLGKFWQRTFPGRTRAHEEWGRRFVEEQHRGFFAPCGDGLAHAIAHHHRWPKVSRDVEKVVILADWLSAKEREKEDRAQEAPSHAALAALLSRPPVAPAGTPELRFSLGPLDWQSADLFFPSEGAAADPAVYQQLWEGFEAEVGRLAGKRGYHPADFTTLLALLRKYTARMPAATPWEGPEQRTVPDVSLYDHLKTTSAIAACLQEELGPDDLDELLSALASARRDSPALQRPLAALVKGDISGTQDFLYLLTAKGAARGLRGRSFYLQMLTEAVARWILRQLGLPRSNLLMAAGGHFYQLLPYRRTEAAVETWRQQIARKLWQIHQGDLSLLVDYVAVAAGDFEEDRDGGRAFAAKWGDVSRKVAARKQRRWRELGDAEFFASLFQARERGGAEPTCQVCHREGQLEEQDGIARCQLCRGFERLGQQLREPKYLAVFEVGEKDPPANAAWHQALQAFGEEVWLCEDLGEAMPPPGARAATVYRLDSTELPGAVPESWAGVPVSYDFRWLAGATPRKGEGEVAEFRDLARAAQGAGWLGVLRMDVDSLGELFRSGLGAQGTISRVSTLSETLRLFFEGWVPGRCREQNRFPQGPDGVFLTYAGGDDLFLVGAWSALPELAAVIRNDFRRFAGGDHLTLSGGAAIEHAKYPLYQLADDARRALDEQAKEHRHRVRGREVTKDAFSFLQTAIGWDRFQEVQSWKERLVRMIQGPPEGQPALPQAFLTRLAEIQALYASNLARRRRFRRRGELKTDDELRELIHYDRWQWQMVYHLGRFCQRYPHFEDSIRELQRAIAREADGLIAVLHVLARWVALLTRQGDDYETS
jgi:CRISPR-associated protein Csm1